MVFLCDSACWRPPQEHAAPIQRLPWGGEFDAGSSEEVLKKHPAVSFLVLFRRQSRVRSPLLQPPLSHSKLFKNRTKKHQLGDPTCLAHLRAAHKASGSLSAFGFPGFTELGPLPWKTAPDDSYEACLKEMRTSFGGALRLLFDQSGLRPEDVDLLVTNSSIFAATPSLSSMLVNEFGMRAEVSTLSVAGMGCSFGVLGVGALRDLMRGHEKSRRGKNVNAVFVTGECITAGFYLGKDPMMLASTGLLRQGAAAVWLSTKSSFVLGNGGGGRGDKGSITSSSFSSSSRRRIRAKYQLQHFVKTHHGADNAAYASMGMRGDSQSRKEGGDLDEQQPERRAVYFSASIPRVASKAIDNVLRAVAPKLMSPKQLFQALIRMREEERRKREREEDEERKEKGLPPAPLRRRRRSSSSKSSTSPPPQGFSFASCCDHFALHPGVHSMLVAFMKGMRLPVTKAMPSFAALRDYGNLSSASTWYVLANLEAVGPGVKKGERVLQLGVGSGVKAGETSFFVAFFSRRSRLKSFSARKKKLTFSTTKKPLIKKFRNLRLEGPEDDQERRSRRVEAPERHPRRGEGPTAAGPRCLGAGSGESKSCCQRRKRKRRRRERCPRRGDRGRVTGRAARLRRRGGGGHLQGPAPQERSPGSEGHGDGGGRGPGEGARRFPLEQEEGEERDFGDGDDGDGDEGRRSKERARCCRGQNRVLSWTSFVFLFLNFPRLFLALVKRSPPLNRRNRKVALSLSLFALFGKINKERLFFCF